MKGAGGDPARCDFGGSGRADIAIYDRTAAGFIVVFPDGTSLIRPFGSKKDANLPI